MLMASSLQHALGHAHLAFSPVVPSSPDGYRLTLRGPSLEPLCHLVLGAKDFSRLSCSFEKVCIRSSFMHSLAEALEEARGHVSWRQSRVKAKVSASLDSDEGKTDGARKALEQMFQGKSKLAKKWEEEIRKRELEGDVGDGGGGGRGWGGGSGDDDMDEEFSGQDEPWDWEEVGQTFMATFALIILYFSITHGPKQVFRLFRLFFRWVRQGFHLRKIPDEYLEGPDTEDEEDEDGNRDENSNSEWLLKQEADASVSKEVENDGRNNHSPNDAVEEESEDEYLPPPPSEYKKESLREKMQAQQQEKMLQMLTANLVSAYIFLAGRVASEYISSWEEKFEGSCWEVRSRMMLFSLKLTRQEAKYHCPAEFVKYKQLHGITPKVDFVTVICLRTRRGQGNFWHVKTCLRG
ncbi:hypothetical protein GOP47_0011474 [Adiantum capillus-veneris]|uniref:Uncharacterized protein n=1 Tax=Adiantum capillus-veneris TaxID=13818 RepID=A0A9D4UT17_ADICA|nr:hypothetical protein GOP47_0011474 [Adiantum capillus-veneris]